MLTPGTCGVGFTVMVKEDCAEQLLEIAVTVIVAIRGVVPVFVAANEGILPVPLAGNPIDGLLLVQEIEAPGVVLVIARLPVFSPLQNATDAGTDKLALELIVNCLVTVVVPHSLVTDKLTVCIPGVVKAIVPGLALLELPEGAPSNNQA